MPQTDPPLLDHAEAMRREMTQPERVIRRHIADFTARSLKLVIEADGDTHADRTGDERHTAWLSAQGYRVVRVHNADVMSNLEGVPSAMEAPLRTPPLPTLSPTGRGL